MAAAETPARKHVFLSSICVTPSSATNGSVLQDVFLWAVLQFSFVPNPCKNTSFLATFALGRNAISMY
jgi:hypothetical protein